MLIWYNYTYSNTNNDIIILILVQISTYLNTNSSIIIIRILVQYYFSSTFFLETKFSIQSGLSQFLFEVNRASIRGEILKKLCGSHHASTHIS